MPAKLSNFIEIVVIYMLLLGVQWLRFLNAEKKVVNLKFELSLTS